MKKAAKGIWGALAPKGADFETACRTINSAVTEE